MKKIFYTKDGVIERELTPQEVEMFANAGDTAAKKEKYKLSKKDTIEERLSAIEAFIMGG